MAENRLDCWNLLPHKEKSPNEMYRILHNYPSDHIKNMKKYRGTVEYTEPYNNFTFDWKELKKAVEWFCNSENCPLGIIRFEEDLAYKRKLIKEDPMLFKCARPELIERMCENISEAEKKYIEEIYELVKNVKKKNGN